MKARPLSIGIGAALFLVGGLIMMFGGGEQSTAVGTTVGLAGLVLIGWTALAGGGRSTE